MKKKVFNLQLSEELHNQLKIAAATNQITIKQLLVTLINDYLGKGREI